MNIEAGSLEIMPNLISNQFTYLGNLVQRKNFWLVLSVDILLIILAHYAAYLLRFPGWFYGPTFDQFAAALPGLVVVKLCIFYGFGLYRGMWRYTSLRDLLNVIKARNKKRGQATLLRKFFTNKVACPLFSSQAKKRDADIWQMPFLSCSAILFS